MHGAIITAFNMHDFLTSLSLRVAVAECIFKSVPLSWPVVITGIEMINDSLHCSIG